MCAPPIKLPTTPNVRVTTDENTEGTNRYDGVDRTKQRTSAAKQVRFLPSA